MTCKRIIAWATAKQGLVPTALLGRVSSVDWFVSLALLPLSYAPAAPLAAAIGVRATFIGAGLIGAVVTLAFLHLPGVRRGAGREQRAGAGDRVNGREPDVFRRRPGVRVRRVGADPKIDTVTSSGYGDVPSWPG